MCEVFDDHCTNGACGVHPCWYSQSGREHKQFVDNLAVGPAEEEKLMNNAEP